MRAIVAVESAIADAPLGCPFPNLRKKKIAAISDSAVQSLLALDR